METIAKGTERYVAKDYTAAIDTFKKAAQLSPKQALAHYLLAEAFIQSNNLGEAEAAIAQALDANDTAKNPALRLLAASAKTHPERSVEELYQLVLSRPPRPAERERLVKYVREGGPGSQPQHAEAFLLLLLLWDHCCCCCCCCCKQGHP